MKKVYMETNYNTYRIWEIPWLDTKSGDTVYDHKKIGTHFGYDTLPSIVMEPLEWRKEKDIVNITINSQGFPIYYSRNFYPHAKYNMLNVISCPKCHSNMIEVDYQNKNVVRCDECNVIMFVTFVNNNDKQVFIDKPIRRMYD